MVTGGNERFWRSMPVVVVVLIGTIRRANCRRPYPPPLTGEVQLAYSNLITPSYVVYSFSFLVRTDLLFFPEPLFSLYLQVPLHTK